jgi:hypothetical protein
MKEDERRKDCGTYGGKRGTYSVLFGKREWRRPRPRHKWKNNIKIDLPDALSEGLTVLNLA